MIPDTENWHVKTGITDFDECNQACINDSENWKWMVFSKATCYCFEAISVGFWHETECTTKVQDEEKVTGYKLWQISCPSLKSMTEKALVLKEHNPSFLIGSNATFECILGHADQSGATTFDIICLSNGEWSVSINELPTCLPNSCSNLDQITIDSSDWNLEHHIKVLKDSHVEQSTISLTCPDEQYFYEKYNGINLEARVRKIYATCSGDG